MCRSSVALKINISRHSNNQHFLLFQISVKLLQLLSKPNFKKIFSWAQNYRIGILYGTLSKIQALPIYFTISDL